MVGYLNNFNSFNGLGMPCILRNRIQRRTSLLSQIKVACKMSKEAKLPATTPCTILFICALFHFTTIPAKSLNNQTDFEALLAFKAAIRHDTQGALNSWNETLNFCSWQGIVCRQNRVVDIDLSSQGLEGFISPHLGNLSFLEYISLQNNSFFGPIPDAIGRLKQLQFIEFSNNSLNGEISKNLSQCTNINYLNLIDNDITGIVPLELSSLIKLISLGFSRNQLSGTIPKFLGNFTMLTDLSLSSCGMQGEIPEALAQLTSLEFLALDENNLTGRVPSGLFNITTMRILGLHNNQLQGTIPSGIGISSPRLTELYLAYNHFTGDIPASISNLSSLSELYLRTNSFTGQLMIDFRRLPFLVDFVLGENKLKGDLGFVSSMKNCTMLSDFDISGNLMTGLLPSSIANLSSTTLFNLRLGENQFHGTIPSGIGNLLNLENLFLRNNELDGPIPSDLGGLHKLQRLDLKGNLLTNEVHLLFNNMTFLSHLILAQNNISGQIPQSLSNWTNLLELDISLNNFNGEIPREILSLSSISISFNLSHNALTGPIPSEVGSLINLLSLDLSHNRFSGTLPRSLSLCLALERVYLQGNSLYGEIPDAMSTLRGVKYLDLSQNNLSGSVPSYFGALDLLYLNLSFNSLEGEVPMTKVFQNMSAISLEGNSGLCGGISLLHYPPCSSEGPKKKRLLKIWITAIILSAGAMCSIFAVCFYLLKRNQKCGKTSSIRHPFESEYRRISYAQLQKATGGFMEANLLGAGKFGSVYKGILEDGQMLAVKVFNLACKGASKSFVSEYSVLRDIRHRNLLKIVSICSSTTFQGNEFKALVYEFMANGDLDKWLHQRAQVKGEKLSMKQRLNIAIDIASALDYLHTGTDSTIVHGDVKPSNILLDKDMTAHVGDFGLTKVTSTVFSMNESFSIGIRGTIGYVPPEYGMGGVMSAKGDVYSYGILLLEMFTGRRPTDDDFKDSSSLRDLVKRSLPGQVMEIVDPAIRHEHLREFAYDAKIKSCLVSVLEIGVACSEELPSQRITMSGVVTKLSVAALLAE